MKNTEVNTDLFENFQFDTPANETETTSSLSSNPPRLLKAHRNQVEIQIGSLDELIPYDHKARLVWKFVKRLDLSMYLKNIKSVENHSGRPAIDPKILVALWLYATIEGIAGARMLGRYCKEHFGFLWICGKVKVGRKTLSNFRAEQGELLDDLLAQSVAIMLEKNLISMDEIGQDGMRLRANASSASFRRLDTLKEKYKAVKEYIKTLKEQMEKDPNQAADKLLKRKMQEAERMEESVKEAIEEMKTIKQEKNDTRLRSKKKKLTKEEVKNLRASTTDKEARKMKMGDGGFRPALNMQFATVVDGQAIVGIDVTNKGNDNDQLKPMFEQIVNRYGVIPKVWLADSGFRQHTTIEDLEKLNCEVYLPPQESKKSDPYKPKKGESKELAKWRERMGSEEGKKKYKMRPQTVEFPNAEARNRGLEKLLVRGIQKALNVGLIFALTHNLLRLNNLSGLFS